MGAYNRWEPVVKGGQPYDQIPDLLERYAELKGIRDRKSKSVLENLDEAGKLLAQASKEKVVRLYICTNLGRWGLNVRKFRMLEFPP